MATHQERNGSYRIIFNHLGKQRSFTLGRVAESEARSKAAQVDYMLMRLKQGLIEIPPGSEVVDYFRDDGAVPVAVVSSGSTSPRRVLTLGGLRDRYLEAHANGTLERHALNGIRRHFGHLTRILGGEFPVPKLRPADLQGYVNERAKAKGRHGALLPTTIRKEIVTLRGAWNWGVRTELVGGRCPADWTSPPMAGAGLGA